MDLIGQFFTLLEVLFSSTPFLILFIFVIALFANVLIRLNEYQPMRPISAFRIIEQMAGKSIESNRPLHVSLGSTAVGDDTTLISLLGSEFIYYMTREVAMGDTTPLFTVTESSSLPLAFDTLRRAYEQENRLQVYNGVNFLSKKAIGARWYPSGRRSLAFAGALVIMQTDDQVSGNVLLGRYGIELSLILDSAHRHNIPTVAVSDHLDGQAVAYAVADDALIGEEVLTVSTYLHDDYRLQKRNFAVDLLRGLVVMTIIALVIYNLVGG
ncbi:MAG: DUF6754 domain-containing protein [Anaerolineae bacterium]